MSDHIGFFDVTGEFLLELLKEKGLVPQDTRLVHAEVAQWGGLVLDANTLRFYAESKKFPERREGEIAPKIALIG